MKKGFSLVELLAVIVIPTVNNILKEARIGAFKSSIHLFFKQKRK